MTFAIRDGRLVGPDGNPFLSLGLNHMDETNLKVPRNVDVWRQQYGSRETWLRDGAVADLRSWGFNTLGWTQEYIAGGRDEALDWFGDPIDLKHSTPRAAPTTARRWTPCWASRGSRAGTGAATSRTPAAAAWGLKDPWDEPYRELTDAITEHNRRAAVRYGRDT